MASGNGNGSDCDSGSGARLSRCGDDATSQESTRVEGPAHRGPSVRSTDEGNHCPMTCHTSSTRLRHSTCDTCTPCSFGDSHQRVAAECSACEGDDTARAPSQPNFVVFTFRSIRHGETSLVPPPRWHSEQQRLWSKYTMNNIYFHAGFTFQQQMQST